MVKQFSYGRNFEYNDTGHIVELIWKAKTKKQLQYLLTAIFTHQELEEAARRYRVGQMLAKGFTYKEIGKEYKMSPVTINGIYKKIKTNAVFKEFLDL
ncbi:hypothetical protein COY62_01810 [bacterium (Candidatus Howlettbacteria) CG_4_10_14_0_8_um_filter_40_9]|nr:MAG: hypothetical protein COY62_01810 [bacterium (Candidatus Howlettbacteria) CG_4_10_14_0_8_um_filter_40_9]